MAKDRSLVRASDLAAWEFCHRAWWLAHVRGAEHRNPAALAAGDAAHLAHGRRVQWARQLWLAGLALVGLSGAALILLLLYWLLV